MIESRVFLVTGLRLILLVVVWTSEPRARGYRCDISVSHKGCFSVFTSKHRNEKKCAERRVLEKKTARSRTSRPCIGYKNGRIVQTQPHMNVCAVSVPALLIFKAPQGATTTKEWNCSWGDSSQYRCNYR